jgi:hypothetical protein
MDNAVRKMGRRADRRLRDLRLKPIQDSGRDVVIRLGQGETVVNVAGPAG